ncbi:hypothetical protein BGK67_31320 [Streptomyces subrutilus]|uniref:Uncharacterized protein n=1 Tax=Streptomyces subrutilus TaxID=36818 RepID=A0A1E5Q012_9ACTN|nr:hypothetical protein BGK67_31320 [Streptomyces subrutilus]
MDGGVPRPGPIGDLDGLRRPGGGALGEERGPAPAHDLDSGPLGQPRGQARCLPARQQVYRAAWLDVHEDGAVVAALAGCVLVDADRPRGRDFRLRQYVDQPQDRAAADCSRARQRRLALRRAAA